MTSLERASPRTAPALIGREAELEQLDAAWARVVAGEARLVLIGGDAGIGKTRLIQEYLDRHDETRFTASGACVPIAGGSLPYTPFIKILRTLATLVANGGGPAAAAPSLPAAVVTELGRLVPAILPPDPDPHPDPAQPGPDAPLARARLFEAVLGYIAWFAAQRPLLLVVEDLHWADSSSRDLLAYVTRNLRSEPILILATYRSDELHRRHPLRSWAAEISRLDVTERVDIGPIAEDDLRLGVTSWLGPAADVDLVDRIVRRAEGNPLFATELVAGTLDGKSRRALPATLRDGFLDMIEHLRPDALRVTRHVAVIGRPATERLLAASTDLAPDRLSAGIHEALDAHVLAAASGGPDDGFEPRHALLGEAVADDLLPGERTTIHRRIAELLEGGVDEDGDRARIAGEIAHHRWAAHDHERAIVASVRAAVAAADARAYGEAAAHWMRALEAWRGEDRIQDIDHPDALVRASVAAVASGQPRLAADLASKGVALIDARAEPARAALARWQLGRHLAAVDHRASSLQYAKAAALVPSVDPPAEAARVLAARAGDLAERMQYARAEPLARRALELARRHGVPTAEVEALTVDGMAQLGRSEHAAAVETLSRAFEDALRLEDPHGTLIRAAYGLCCALSSSGRWSEALRHQDRFQTRMDRLGLGRVWGWWIHDSRVDALLGLGRLREAEQVVEDLRTHLRPEEYPWTGVVAAVVLARRGRIDEAATIMRAGAADQYPTAFERLEPMGCLTARAEVAAAHGDWTEVRGTVDRAFATVPAAVRDRYPRLRLFALLGLQAEAELAFDARIHRDDDAEAEAQGIARVRTAWLRTLAGRVAEAGEPLAAAVLADAAFGEALLARVEHRAAPDAWRLAVERCLVVGNPYDIARARHWLADSILDGGGSRLEAAAELSQASEIARAMGAAVLEGAIDDLARRARLQLTTAADDREAAEPAPSPAQERDGSSLAAAPTDNPTAQLVETLTPRELEVLGYLAAGWTNRRVGEALFISEKTVSVHVSNLLGKLGASNRAEAALIGDRMGLLPAAAEA